MQVEVNVTCTHTSFGGHSLSGFGDIATFKIGQSSLSDHYSPWSSKKLFDWNRLEKFMQVGIDVKCMHTLILVGMDSPVSEILLLSKAAKFPFPTMDSSPWSSKNLNDWSRLKEFMQIGVYVTCMHTNFGGHSLSSFGDIATFKNGQFSLSNHGLYIHGHQKI